MNINGLQYCPAVIESGNTSNGVSIGQKTIVGFFIPQSFEGTALTFNAGRVHTADFVPVKDPTTGSDVSVTVAANTFVPILPSDLAGIANIQIKSNQPVAASREILIVTRNAM